MEDAQIIALFLARKEDALTQTEAHYGEHCRRIAMNILHSALDADECVNDTFLRAWNTIPPQQPTHFGAFLGKITRNLALNRLRDSHTQKRGEPPLSLEQLTELCDCIPDGRTSFAETMAVTPVLQRFISALPTDQRRMFLRRYWYCSSIADIARDFGCTQSKVKTTLFRLRAKLKEELAKEDIFI